MRTIILLLVSLVASTARAQTSTVTLAWDAVPAAAGYSVEFGHAAGGPYPSTRTTGAGVTTITLRDVDRTQPTFFIVKTFDRFGLLSGPSNETSLPSSMTNDPCAPITGQYAVSIFPTFLTQTGNGGPGSRTRLLFQLASPNAPVVRVEVKGNGALLTKPMRGDELTDVPGSWFYAPASGTYVLTVTATNSQGCATTVPYRSGLVVP